MGESPAAGKNSISLVFRVEIESKETVPWALTGGLELIAEIDSD